MENKIQWIRYILVWIIILLIPAIMGYTAHDFIEPYIKADKKDKPVFSGMSYTNKDIKTINRNLTKYLESKNATKRRH